MRIRTFAAALAVPVLANGALAQPAALPDDVVSMVSGVDALCAGNTQESRTAWAARGFALRLEFVGKGGQYLGDEDVTITGKDFRAQLQCRGPWVMMDLKPGTYHVNAVVADAGQQEFDVTVPRTGRQVRAVRFENAGGVSATAGQGAPPDVEPDITTQLNRDTVTSSNAADAQYRALRTQYDDLSKALASQQSAIREHQQSYDTLIRARDDFGARSRTAGEQCAGLQAIYDALQKRRTEEKNWTVTRTREFETAQNDYLAKKTDCDQRNASLASEQSDLERRLVDINALIVKDHAEDTRLQTEFTKVKAGIDAYSKGK
jgi:hypothetical protein